MRSLYVSEVISLIILFIIYIAYCILFSIKQNLTHIYLFRYFVYPKPSNFALVKKIKILLKGPILKNQIHSNPSNHSQNIKFEHKHKQFVEFYGEKNFSSYLYLKNLKFLEYNK